MSNFNNFKINCSESLAKEYAKKQIIQDKQKEILLRHFGYDGKYKEYPIHKVFNIYLLRSIYKLDDDDTISEEPLNIIMDCNKNTSIKYKIKYKPGNDSNTFIKADVNGYKIKTINESG
jgi:hypothetical protein